MILVGDSLGQVMLGYESTVRVTMDEMLHHTRAVVRGTQRALVVGDMPFLTYASPSRRRSHNAGRFMRDGGAQAVKIEGGVRSARIIEASSRPASRSWATSAGHPRRSTRSARSASRARTASSRASSAGGRAGGPGGGRLLGRPGAGARAAGRADHGAAARSRPSASVPAPAAPDRSRSSPTCWGWATSSHGTPSRTRDLRETIDEAVRAYAADVAAGTFPGAAQTVRMDDAVLAEALGQGDLDRAGHRGSSSAIPQRPASRSTATSGA